MSLILKGSAELKWVVSVISVPVCRSETAFSQIINFLRGKRLFLHNFGVTLPDIQNKYVSIFISWKSNIFSWPFFSSFMSVFKHRDV